ncbi:phage protein [Streptococcus pneumoniae]|nr:phage protein [Streptococcus pneumoniae]
MSFTPSLYIFSHGEAFEARANIEKTKKAKTLSVSAIISIILLYHKGGRDMTPEQVKEKLEGVKWINKFKSV